MKKLKIPANLTVLAYNSIKEYILEGDMDGTARLTEEFLSTRLGISKSPIREALNRLEAEGLIRIEARRGAYLRTFSIKEIDELYDLREALEVHAVRTAKVTPALIAELQQSIVRLRKHREENDKVKYIEEDVSFHAALVQATGSSLLVKEFEGIQNRIWLCRRNTYDLSSSSAPDSHEAIASALETDRAAAQQAMSDHISLVRRTLTEHLSRQEAEKTPLRDSASPAGSSA
jgi:DNA-binding GntR family transcriptional regulator